MPWLILTAAVVSLAIAGIVLWANPHRFVNQVFALSSVVSATWLICIFMAQIGGMPIATEHPAGPVPWLRTASASGAFFPWIIWLLKEAIAIEGGARVLVLRRSIPWLLIGIALAGLSYSGTFVVADSQPGLPMRGFAYTVYLIVSFCLYCYLAIQAIDQMQKQSGIRRLEFQFLTVGAAVACLAALALNAAGYFLNERLLSRFSPIAVLAFYALTAWAVTFHRVFDARQVFLSLGQRAVLVLALGLGVLAGRWLLAPVVPSPFDLFFGVAMCGPLAFWLDRSSRDWLRLSPAQKVAEVRRAAAELARTQPSPDKLVGEFENLLKVEYQASVAQLLFDSGEIHAASDLQIAKSRPGHAALVRAGWATPESLQRQRAAPGLVDLRQILTEHDLGLLVPAPRGSPDPTMIIALGVKTNKRPFTYPEVQQLQEIAEFMDNVLARSRLTLQARRSEQLAVIGLVGASLAHEIRNPLVSIKTFAHLLPSRFDDPDFRKKFHRLIPTEVDRIDNLTQQLLDLAHPRSHILEPCSLHTIIRETIDLIQTNANEAKVSLIPLLQASPDTILADASAIRQVVLNLLINAIQALESRADDRTIEVSTRSPANGGVVLEVTDNGPGISAEQRSRLFHPFASTKTKGIGLGLAICADILREHHATINVPDIGRPGATFRVTFPCPQPSS